MDDQRPYAVVALMQCDAVASAGFVNECGEDLGRQPGGWDPRKGKKDQRLLRNGATLDSCMPSIRIIHLYCERRER